MKRKIIVAGVLLMLVFSLIGCASEKRNINKKNEIQNVTDMNNSGGRKLLDNVYALYEMPKVSTCTVYNATRGISKSINLEGLFSKEPEIVESENRTTYNSREDEEFGVLSANKNNFYYCTPKGNGFDSWSQALRDNPELFENINENEINLWCSDESARDDVKNRLSEIGIIDPVLTVYPVTEEMFNEYCEYYNENLKMGAKDYSAEDLFGTYKEFFYMEGELKYDGLTIFNGIAGNVDNGSGIFGSSMSIIYTNKGIEYLYISNSYEVDVDSGRDVGLEDFPIIENNFEKTLDNIIFEETVSITEVHLIYMPVPNNSINDLYNDFEMTPVWEFSADSGEKWYFNAVSGKEIS